jgi:uncharacterized Zn finger protein
MPITEATIRNLTTVQSYERGQDYYRRGMVYDVQKRGDALIAEVEGSGYEPYKVTVEVTEDEVLSTWCTCPYDGGGDCKHIVAVLLTYLHKPDQITERSTIDDLLTNLGEAELRELLTNLLETEPHLVDWVETKLTPPVEQGGAINLPASRSDPVDPTPFRRQARQLLRGHDYYGAAWGIAGQMLELLGQAQPFLEAGQGRNALLILEAVTEPYIDSWFDFDDSDGELGGVFDEIGPLFTEAILSADLSPAERQAWAKKFTAWQGEIEDYGIDEGFDTAMAAAEHGWDYPPLLKVLQEGHVSEQGAWGAEVPWYADELTVARLNVLERQGRTTEYLNLAEAEGQTARYLTMLVKLDRNEDALAYGMQYMATADEALVLAQALREHDQPTKALKIAEHGLTLEGETVTLARWLRDFAAETFQPDVAVKAARIAFARSFSLEDYQAVETAAGAEWPALKSELLDQLAAVQYAFGRIDIYLHEGMVDEAVQDVDRQSYTGYGTVERVVEVAWQSHPEWVIRQCKKQAEPIMDGGKSKYYHHAVRWLEKVGRTYLGSNRDDEWRAYLESLISKHARKYSLRPQLEALRKYEL